MNRQEVTVSKKSFTGRQVCAPWRAAGCLVVVVALGAWLTRPAFAQEQASAATSASPAASKAKNSGSASTAAAVAVKNDSSSDNSQTSDSTATAPGPLTLGNYSVEGSIEAGGRYSNITGSQANYDTFVNLQQGPRLLGFSLNLRSLNHNGSLFDNLSLTGFGFGGDPVDVVRLDLSKNKWYNFDATYRRYKYFWGYNLLDQPLNPANTNQPIATAPHLMDLSHRMTDLQLTLLPQSSVRFRLGYAHSLEVGPSYTTEGAAVAPISETGALALLFQNFKTTDDSYQAGVDFNIFPRTTLSYDQFVNHYKEDTFDVDRHLNYQLPNGVPVDLGLAFSTAAGTPCNPATTSTPVSPGCQGNLYFDRGGRPRGTTPTEHFSFQSTYFRNLSMTGLLSYSSGYQRVNDLFDAWGGLNTRTQSAGTQTQATSDAHQIVVNGDWNAVYQITSKFRAMESVDYNDFQIPGIYNFGVANFYAQLAPGGGYSMELPPGQFNSANCPPPFTASTCPQHNSSSNPDVALGYRNRYLGQKWLSNTFQLAYDFTPRLGAHIGYRYVHRKIYDQNALFYTAETFYPGGSTDPATAAALAARGDCAIPSGGNFPADLPAGCTLESDGSVVFSGLTADSDTEHGLVTDIHGNSALFGMWVRPANNFRSSFNLELFSADSAFTRITPRLTRHYQINSTYTPVHWAEVTGAVDIVSGSDNVLEVSNEDHDRSYSISTVLTPASRFSFDLSYNYNDIYTQALDCYTVGFGPAPAGAAACPVYPDLSEVNVSALSAYQSKSNFASADLTVKPAEQVTFTLGYAGSFVRGTTSWFNPLSTYAVAFLDPRTPYGPLRFNYQSPYISLNWLVYRGLSYNANWNYYGYNSRGNDNPVGLAPLGTQDFNGNNMTLSVKYAF